MLKVLDDGSQLKPYNVAKTALLGLTSIQMAKGGFIGHHDSLSGRGFLKMMTGNEETTLCRPLSKGTYAIEKSYTKPYAACRYCHPAIEAAIKLGKMIDINEIESILVQTYDLAVSGHEHTDIHGIGSAKMSIPYGVSVGLLFAKAGLAEYTKEYTLNPRILEMAKKVKVLQNDEYSKKFPEFQIGHLKITLNDGTEICEQVDFPKGEPENPMNKEEFIERFNDLLKYGDYSIKDGKNIIDFCDNDKNSVKDLCDII